MKKVDMVGLMLKQMINKLKFLLAVVIFSSNLYAITVYEVIEKVVNNSPELRIIFEKKNQVIDDYNDSKSAYMPKIYFIYNREYSKSDPLVSSEQHSWTSSNKFQFILEQRIFDMEQISKIVRSAQSIQNQEFQNQKLLETLIQMSVVAYYDVIQGEYFVSIFREYLRQVRSMEQLTVSMRQQGDATSGDLSLVQSRLASANSDLIMAQSSLDKARLRLAYLLNLVDKNQVIDTDSVLPDLSNKDFYDLGDRIINIIPLTPDALINHVLSNNIDILTIRSGLCVAGYDVEIQKSRYLPTLNMIAELRSEQNRGTSNFDRYGKISFEARYMIYDGGSRSASVSKSSALLKEVEYQYDILVRDTSDQAFSSLNQLRSYEQQRVSIIKEIEAAEEVDRVYSLQFQFATRSLTDRLDNLDRLARARNKLVQVDYSILIIRMQILMIMGNFVDFFGFQNYLEVNSLKLC